MKLILLIEEGKNYGQIPIVDENGKTYFFLQGKLHNINHTLFLKDYHNHELGRLYLDQRNLINKYVIDLVDGNLGQVHQLSHLEFPMLLRPNNYLITGSTKKGSYHFRSAFKEIAECQTMITKKGQAIVCDIININDIPYVLLITGLFSQWNTTMIKLPDLQLNKGQLTTDY
ncbi:hypothetical protein [Lactobacillus psittaci]|uniref:YxjI n=1 Tax=Lactobacillus psittaci DSM 15354 TaxID=1122152 RepID=A0A0R1S3U6_9LACO|nr:hypothetical protein [Lactobacillus psittaci]KRL63910.1 hypothetical protein FC23_GL000157 [Lactobacillus psittaci DSM 15354]